MNFGSLQISPLRMIAELTPRQRWDAVTSYSGQYGNHQSYIWLGILLILILTTWLAVIIYRRRTSKPSDTQHFSETAQKKDLTDREYRILMDMAAIAGLTRSQSIFTLPTAFNRAAATLIQNVYRDLGELQGAEIKAELDLLREKLGFEAFRSSGTSMNKAVSEKQTSFQIPVKKKLYINRFGNPSEDLEAVVIANTSKEFTIELKQPVQVVFGNPWKCRYYTGHFVAEFQTTPLQCSGNIVSLKHSHHIRMVNRRRFLRVPMNSPAYIAHFPFKKDVPLNTYQPRRKLSSIEPKPKDELFEPPTFSKATVCELGGPGLKVETELNVKVGDRLLLIFMTGPGLTSSDQEPATRLTSVIEGIVLVRHVTKKNDLCLSIAVEFENLSDRYINQLVQVANQNMVSMKKTYDSIENSEVGDQTDGRLQPV